jgi:hypothetical protein
LDKPSENFMQGIESVRLHEMCIDAGFLGPTPVFILAVPR